MVSLDRFITDKSPIMPRWLYELSLPDLMAFHTTPIKITPYMQMRILIWPLVSNPRQIFFFSQSLSYGVDGRINATACLGEIMKLKMLLWYMARRMEMLTITHPEFIAKLHGRNCIIQIIGRDNTQRFFHFHRSRVRSTNRVHLKPDVTLRFHNNELAFKLMTQGNTEQFLQALKDQQINIVGDFNLLLWFMSITPYLKPNFNLSLLNRDKLRKAS